MTMLARRQRSAFADLIDWFESESPTMPAFRHIGGTHVIRVEDYTEKGQYVLRAELPGVDPDKDVEITVQDGILTVTAERREDSKDEQRSEFRYGSFTRSLALPAGADEEDVRATYHDGILEVRVSLAEAKQPESKRVPVTKG